jgi:PST family polysaccharide transporter
MYSGAFEPAVDILRWQLLGDIPKVMSWPLGYILLAAGAGRTFVLTETLAMCVFVSGVAIGLPRVGVTATGVAFLALYAFYLPLVRWLGGRRIGFRWTPAVKAQAAAVMIAALAVEGATRWSDATGAIVGAAIASALAIWALIRLSSRAEIGGRLGDTAALGEQVRRWIKARF